jgi:hypothetical protein
LFSALAVLLFSCVALAAKGTREQLVEEAVSADNTAAAAAIRELRLMGQPGLDALIAKYAADIEKYSLTGDADAKWTRIAAALDTVAMQRDAYAADLYWYTDLDEAKRVAKRQHKPVLSLRLLGNLNEEFSCANSRLFRAILYPNAEISQYLHDNYILHWRSVRPAPRITIDFGDGRKIERTITGNSIHYILSEDGQIIDAIPGLYSPAAFLGYLKRGNEMNASLRSIVPARQALALMQFRKKNFDLIVAERRKALDTAGVQLGESKKGSLAILAAPMAVAKAVVVDEYSILRVYDEFAKFEPNLDLDDWDKLAKLYSPNPTPDAKSVQFIRRQNAKTGLSEDEFKSLFAKLDRFIALDTTRNDFLFHAKLYEWLNQRGAGDLESLNSRVYDQIFQTPDYDKWLGLYSTDVYTALDGNGIIK